MANFESLIAEFNKLGSREDVIAFAARFGLGNAGEHNRLQVIGYFKGQVDGIDVTVTHHWYDRCRAFDIRPDGNEVELNIAGQEPCKVKFLDRY